MFAAVTRRTTAGLSLLDLVIVLGLLAVLVYFVRQDWRHAGPAPAAHGATHSSFTSV